MVCLVSSCKDSDDASDFYPNVVTEFAMLRTDDAGTMVELTTDDERVYTLKNPQPG